MTRCKNTTQSRRKPKHKFTSALANQYKSFKPGRNQYEAKCLVCPPRTYVSVACKGAEDLETHCRSQKHKKNLQRCSGAQDISTASGQSTSSSHAEKLAVAMSAFDNIMHHDSYPSGDCIPQLYDKLFDCPVAKLFRDTWAEANSIVNEVLGPHSIDAAMQSLKEVSCFGVCTDGIYYASLNIYPILIQFFDYKQGGMQTKLVDLKSIPVETSDTISSHVTDTLRQLGIIEKCVAFGGEYTITYMGGPQWFEGDNVLTKLKTSVNQNVVGTGCPTNVLLLCIERGADRLDVDLEAIVMMVYHYLITFAVQTEELEECKMVQDYLQDFVRFNFQQLTSTVKTRWRYMFPAIQRLLEMYDPLQSYFLSLPDPPPKLKTFFTSKLSKAYLWLLHSLMSLFHESFQEIQKERDSIVDVMNVLEHVCSLLKNRLESPVVSLDVQEQLLCARKEGFDSEVDAFMEDAGALYRNCYDYLQKWSVSFKDFDCFKWMALNGKVLMQDVAKSIGFLREKGHIIDDAKCCDQLYSLNLFLEQNHTELATCSINDRWVKYFESKPQEGHSELLKMAEYFFSLPAHNAVMEKMFSLMRIPENARLSKESVKGLLCLKFNFKDFSCDDFYDYLSGKPDIFTTTIPSS